jgi:serine/threonine protein kinase
MLWKAPPLDYFCTYHGFGQNKNGDRCLLLEYCNGGDLGGFLKARGRSLSEKETQIITKKIVKGIDEAY